MKDIQPRRPSHLSHFAQTCLDALAQANLGQYISIGGALGLFHYLDYRPTHDVDAWWSDSVTEEQRSLVIDTLERILSTFGNVRVRKWGDVESVELRQEDRTVFSFQIARRSARLEDPISAGWIDVPLDSLVDLMASKMVALIERGAPRDFLDVFTLCHSGLFTIADCWNLWRKRQSLAGSDTDFVRANLAIQTHLERISLHRPLEQIEDVGQREQSRRVRDWFLNSDRKTMPDSPWLDGTLYPDTDVPESLDKFADRVDFLARLCAAWDFGLLPEAVTIAEIRREDWREAVEACRLLTSPAYHLLRRWHGLNPLPYLGQQIAMIRDDSCLVSV